MGSDLIGLAAFSRARSVWCLSLQTIFYACRVYELVWGNFTNLRGYGWTRLAVIRQSDALCQSDRTWLWYYTRRLFVGSMVVINLAPSRTHSNGQGESLGRFTLERVQARVSAARGASKRTMQSEQLLKPCSHPW